MDTSAAVENAEEIGRVKNSDDLVAENNRGVTNVNNFERSVVDLLNLKLFVENDKSVRRIAHDCVGEALRLVLEVWQTHGNLSLALKDCNSLFTAGIVAAGAAIQLV